MGGIFKALLVAAALLTVPALAQEPAKPEVPDQAQLEQKFKDLLAESVFVGRWCLIRDGKLTEEKEERYTIQGAAKSGQDVWLIYARIQYGGKDVTVPVPVQVKWAGNTPVITLDNATLPGLGTYTARVLVFNNTYAGTWSGGDHAGLLHGVIEKQKK